MMMIRTLEVDLGDDTDGGDMVARKSMQYKFWIQNPIVLPVRGLGDSKPLLSPKRRECAHHRDHVRSGGGGGGGGVYSYTPEGDSPIYRRRRRRRRRRVY